MPTQKRSSGGARAVAKKHAERDAARGRSPYWLRKAREAYRDLGDFPKDLELGDARALRSIQVAIRLAETDPGLPPEGKAHLLAQLAPQYAKLRDQAKLTQKLAEAEAELVKLRKRLLELQAQVKRGSDAFTLETGEGRAAPPGSLRQ